MVRLRHECSGKEEAEKEEEEIQKHASVCKLTGRLRHECSGVWHVEGIQGRGAE
jgi:hypothetical protein